MLIREYVEPQAGTDFPCFVDKNGNIYDAAWDMGAAYPFGYWPIDAEGNDYHLFVGSQCSMHSEPALQAAKQYINSLVENEAEEDADTIEMCLEDLYGDLYSYKLFQYDEDEDALIATDGTGEKRPIETVIENILEQLRTFSNEKYYIQKYVWDVITKGEYPSKEDISADLMETFDDEIQDISDVNPFLGIYAANFDEYFQMGTLQGRVWLDQDLFSFYDTPSPQELSQVIHDLPQALTTVGEDNWTVNDFLGFRIIYNDYNYDTDKETVSMKTVGEFIGATKPKAQSSQEEPLQMQASGRQFIPHLASQDEKRKFYSQYRQNKDQTLYAPISKALGSVAKYNWLRHPYGENKERISQIIREELERMFGI